MCKKIKFLALFACLLLLSIEIAAQRPQPVPMPIESETDGALKLPSYKKVQLKNGMTLLLMEQHEVPIVSFAFALRAGGTADPAGKTGLASLTAGLLERGTKTRTADQFGAQLDFIGGEFAAGATQDYTFGSAEFVAKDLNKGLELFADALLNPAFAPAEVDKQIAQRVDAIKGDKDEAQTVISRYFNAYLFGAHPYARPVSGDEKTLAAIKREDIVKFYQATYAPANMILAVVGDFNAAEMEKNINAKFGAWTGAPAKLMKPAAPVAVSGKKLLLIDKPDSTQTFYQIGNIGVARTNADRVYLNVVNTLFGGRFTSMLNSELRIQTGLTYGARSSFDLRQVSGTFVISTYTRNEKTEEAIDRTLAILKRLHEKGITQTELDSAKKYIKGQFPTRIETSDQLAARLVELEFFGLDEKEINDYYRQIDAMTLADAQRVIKQYYPLDNLVFVLIGKAAEINKVAVKYAPKMDVKSVSAEGF